MLIILYILDQRYKDLHVLFFCRVDLYHQTWWDLYNYIGHLKAASNAKLKVQSNMGGQGVSEECKIEKGRGKWSAARPGGEENRSHGRAMCWASQIHWDSSVKTEHYSVKKTESIGFTRRMRGIDSIWVVFVRMAVGNLGWRRHCCWRREK